jgi:hypothetical protein
VLATYWLRSKLSFSARRHQSCRRASKTENCGGGNCGSAKAPSATTVSSGYALNCQQTVAPQFGQKWKVAALPLSAVLEKREALPEMVRISSLLNRACVPNTLPVRCWQHRQWQIETRTGPPSQIKLSRPQLHDACFVTRISAQRRGLQAKAGWIVCYSTPRSGSCTVGALRCDFEPRI